MATISSLVSFKCVLNDGRIRKIFYLFLMIITDRRGLACYLFYLDGKSCFNKYTDKLQKCTDSACMACLTYSVFMDLGLLQSSWSHFMAEKTRSQSRMRFARAHTAAPAWRRSSLSVPLCVECTGHPFLREINSPAWRANHFSHQVCSGCQPSSLYHGDWGRITCHVLLFFPGTYVLKKALGKAWFDTL